MTDDTVVTAPPKTPKGQVTEYVILERVDALTGHSAGWAEFAREHARDAETAIRGALDGNTDGGTFIAVPLRSWRPVTVTPETVTTLKLEEVKA